MDYYMEGEEKFGRLTTMFYNSIAWRLLKKLYKFSINRLDGLSPSTIMDIGAGPGRFSLMVAKKFPGARIYCVDPSPYMVETERKLFKKNNINAVCVQGSSREVPLNEKFDLIITSLSYHHWLEKEKSLDYLSSLLNINGSIFIFEFLRESYKSPFQFMYREHSLSINDAKNIHLKNCETMIDTDKNFIAVKITRTV
ncbi:class I SAM-dependent methyltransferase [Picrophilus oshimae]|uniref:SAM-dependent methyltransferase n=1 Tax=Picrophilus torridus (strain ATCC 700027 / DSM 9790 / JCM 10055 / NBRC 100828 / KAW 2/3) TaxID=1122961 RepID=Q6L2V4_PICTO|nr:class I SAM-dependent methyltransferase [Picrophilus oshimae]AAT42698.1 SAM-dependent methyltransferase [Picrophilus oshimae DSM 9789]